jgi:hypothetical protein
VAMKEGQNDVSVCVLHHWQTAQRDGADAPPGTSVKLKGRGPGFGVAVVFGVAVAVGGCVGRGSRGRGRDRWVRSGVAVVLMHFASLRSAAGKHAPSVRDGICKRLSKMLLGTCLHAAERPRFARSGELG